MQCAASNDRSRHVVLLVSDTNCMGRRVFLSFVTACARRGGGGGGGGGVVIPKKKYPYWEVELFQFCFLSTFLVGINDTFIPFNGNPISDITEGIKAGTNTRESGPNSRTKVCKHQNGI